MKFSFRSLAVLLVLLWFTSLSPLGAPVEAASWTSLNPMAAARSGHTVTLLPTGKVLVAGGNGLSSSILNSAELYDPATGNWSSAGAMSGPRTAHTATLMPNGKVLIAGGYDGKDSLQSAETYDPVTGTWSPASDMSNICYGHTATLLPNGRVLVVGGWTGSDYLSGAEIYDPATNTWTSTSNSMITSRYVHNAALLSDGKVLVTGGYNMLTGGGSLNSAEIYDPATGPNGTWSETTFLSAARHYHTATLLPNSKVLVSGGSSNTACLDSAELYDPDDKTWTPTSGNLKVVRALHSASLLPNGKVLVTGGYNSLSPSLSPLDSAEVFDPDTGLWSPTASLPFPIGQPSSTLLPDGRVLSTGGSNGSSVLNSVEIYNYAELYNLYLPLIKK